MQDAVALAGARFEKCNNDCIQITHVSVGRVAPGIASVYAGTPIALAIANMHSMLQPWRSRNKRRPSLPMTPSVRALLWQHGRSVRAGTARLLHALRPLGRD
jgi:hypothetical protein